MSSGSELSDSEDLPSVPFLSRREVLLVSSDSEGEGGPKPLAPPQRTIGGRAAPAKLRKPRVPGGGPQPKKGKKGQETVTVLIDPGILQNGCGGQVLSALQAQETPCVIQSQAIPRSITWSRSSADGNEEGLSQEEAEVLILLPGEEFVTMVQNLKKEPLGGSSRETLHNFVARVTAGKSWKVPTLVIMEMEKYFSGGKKLSRKKQKEPLGGEVPGNGKKRLGKRKESPETLPTLTRVEVEEVLMDFQLHTGTHVWFLETWKEFADFVCQFSKAVSEAPTKRQRDNTSFSFYLDGEWAGGVRVERCGKGHLEVWRRQIQQFNRISVDIANAVVAAYPSPHLLVKAYRCCRTEEERQNLLSDILVRRGEGVTSTSRRVGPEISKRIYLQMTSKEPELSLELT
ncbi:hypothetical protein XENTR_v10004325 [Xenopus tropicalis]|uniref:ERCC4 domain-containing protein n=1 Tax=Xenopus tropicalis TaxID=8364 RepID=A0A6I8PRV4_XENTR|nr:hypothetical protein XENTR_v10004325 [Xenopus tropicalis]